MSDMLEEPYIHKVDNNKDNIRNNDKEKSSIDCWYQLNNLRA